MKLIGGSDKGLRFAYRRVVFVDYLRWRCIDGKWLSTSKGYHLGRSV